MSEIAMAASDEREGLFRPRTVALILAIGLVGFLGMLVLGAFAPDMRSGRNGGAHALSNAAVGFSGIVRLAAATGREPQLPVRAVRHWREKRARRRATAVRPRLRAAASRLL